MSIICFIRDQGLGPYCEGSEDDFAWVHYGADSIVVPKQPAIEYFWNGTAWERTEETLKETYVPQRIEDFRRTDVYRRDISLTDLEIIQRDLYYSSLENLDFSDVDNFTYPVCPRFMDS